MIKKAILELFGVRNERELRLSDRILVRDLMAVAIGQQKGGGFSIRPEMGEINGMSQRTGYLDKHPPIFVGELLREVATTVGGIDPCETSIVRPSAEWGAGV